MGDLSLDQGDRPVTAAVVDEDHLHTAVEPVDDGADASEEEREDGFLIVDRNDQGVDGRGHVRTAGREAGLEPTVAVVKIPFAGL